ncbi:uncharacterized protein TNCV_248181 [Trichonephila clavipes]|nr:uncharacterized protein TNCV_248181 [Trichonephila clavipes]
MDDPIFYELRVISIATGSFMKCYNPKSFPSFKVSLELFFSRILRPHVTKTVRDFCSVKHLQLLPWHVYAPDMLPIEHVWDLVGQRLARDLVLKLQKRNFYCAYKQYKNLFHKQTFKIC